MRSDFARTSLWMMSGPMIWAGHFLLIYAYTALVCAQRMAPGFLPWVIGAVTILAAGAIVAILRASRWMNGDQRNTTFIRWITLALGALALLAIVWEASAVLFLPACASAQKNGGRPHSSVSASCPHSDSALSRVPPLMAIATGRGRSRERSNR